MKIAPKSWPPLRVSIAKVTRLREYFDVGRDQEALQIIEGEKEKIRGSFPNLLSFGYLTLYISEGNIEKAEEHLQNIIKHVQKYGSPGGIELFYIAEIKALKRSRA